MGYDKKEREWELILRYDQKAAAGREELASVIPLSFGYGIIRIPESRVEALAALPEIEYIEKPKRLYFSVNQGRAASCISALQTAEYNLFGEGVLVAVIDSGVDYFHPDFRDDDGNTRIVAIWDQTARGQTDIRGENTRAENRQLSEQRLQSPEGFTQGVEYTREMIDAALAAGSREAAYRIVPEQDLSGHGTQVLGIAAGNGRASGGVYRGVAPLADILVVKLGTPQPEGFPRTTELMQAVEYVVRKAQQLDMPVVINLSFGNAYGSHEPYN